MLYPETYLTLGEAAKQTGVSKTTLSRAVKSGKLSIKAREGNSYKIDPMDLFNVFPAKRNVNDTMTQPATGSETIKSSDETVQIQLLQKDLEHARALLQKAEEEKTKLEARYDALHDTLKSQTLLLADVRDNGSGNRKGFFARLFSK